MAREVLDKILYRTGNPTPAKSENEEIEFLV